jgi:hypothetical protein
MPKTHAAMEIGKGKVLSTPPESMTYRALL